MEGQRLAEPSQGTWGGEARSFTGKVLQSPAWSGWAPLIKHGGRAFTTSKWSDMSSGPSHADLSNLGYSKTSLPASPVRLASP